MFGSEFLKKTKENVVMQKKYLTGIISKFEEIEKIGKVLATHKIKRVFLTGCGDSFFAAIAGEYFFQKYTSIDARAVQAFELLNHYRGFFEGDLLISFSASGQTMLTIKVTEKAKKQGAITLCITNNPKSTITSLSDFIINTSVDVAFGPPTAVSTTAVLALLIFSVSFGFFSNALKQEEYQKLKNQINRLPEHIKWIYDNEKIQRNNILFAKKTKKINDFYIVGSGPAYVTALFTQAKFKELSWVHSEAIMLEEFCHYGLIPVDNRSAVILIDTTKYGKGKIRRIVEFMKELKVPTYYITNDDTTEITADAKVKLMHGFDDLLYIVEAMIPLHFLAIHLALEREQFLEKFRYQDVLSELIGYED